MDLSKLKREQYAIASALAGAIRGLNCAFCAGDGIAEIADEKWMEEVALGVLEFLDNEHMAIEDTMDVLRIALEFSDGTRE